MFDGEQWKEGGKKGKKKGNAHYHMSFYSPSTWTVPQTENLECHTGLNRTITTTIYAIHHQGVGVRDQRREPKSRDCDV